MNIPSSGPAVPERVDGNIHTNWLEIYPTPSQSYTRHGMDVGCPLYSIPDL